MKKIIYTKEDGTISIVNPSPKEVVEKVLGLLTQSAYEQHVWERSVPIEVLASARYVDEVDLPATREFRDAWVNVTELPSIDICCARARDVKLAQLRRIRNEELEKLDKEFMIGVEKGLDLTDIKNRKEALRNVTEPLKALNVVGKVNDAALLQQIRDLGQL